MSLENYYSILNIDYRATDKEIIRAYRNMALKFHPDINKSPSAHDLFIKIHEAYEILKDPAKRKIYDEKYYEFFLKKEQTINIDDILKDNPDFDNWKNQAKQNGEQYSQMTFQDYKNEILDKLVKIYDTTKKTTELGCGLITSLAFLIIGILLTFKYIDQIIKLISGEIELHSGIFIGPFVLAILYYVGIKGTIGLLKE